MKKPPEVKWVNGNWRYPDGTYFHYNAKHPHTGKGGKGVKKSAEHRRKLSESNRRANNTPEEKARRSAVSLRNWQDPDFRARASKGWKKSIETRRKQRLAREAEKKQALTVLKVRKTTRADTRPGLIKATATQLLQAYGCEILPDQPIEYYEEIIKALSPKRAALLKLK